MTPHFMRASKAQILFLVGLEDFRLFGGFPIEGSTGCPVDRLLSCVTIIML